jgi:hypothetical protein
MRTSILLIRRSLAGISSSARRANSDEKGVALIMALLTMALMLALTMAISLTAISELGVSNTYGNQTQAFEAAEAGLYHALNLVRNFDNHTVGTTPDFTKLLLLRPTNPPNPNYLLGNNPFIDSSAFVPGSTMITDAVDAGGHTILNAKGNPVGHQLVDANGNAVPGAYYSVHLIDDERSGGPVLPAVPNFNPDLTLGPWEDGNASKDTNNRVVIYSTGTYGSSSVTLEGWVGFVPYPALVAQKDITVSGNAQILGAYGGVHSNGNLTVSGSADIAQTATASGTGTFTTSGTIGGFHAGGQPQISVPKFVTAPTATSSPHLQDYIVQSADVVLLDPGFADTADRNLATSDAITLRVKKLADSLGVPSSQYSAFASAIDSNASGNVTQSGAEAIKITRTTNPATISFSHETGNLGTYGWNYSGGNWDIPSNSSGADGHTFYIVGVDNYNTSTSVVNGSIAVPQNGGNVTIHGNAGSQAAPIHTTILATGSIQVNGNPYLAGNAVLKTPELPPFVQVRILFAAVEDIQIKGDVGAGNGQINFAGICYAGEQVDLSGSGDINGQIIALDNPNVSGTGGATASPVNQTNNTVTGHFTLDFDGGQAIGKIVLMSWRQIKE